MAAQVCDELLFKPIPQKPGLDGKGHIPRLPVANGQQTALDPLQGVLQTQVQYRMPGYPPVPQGRTRADVMGDLQDKPGFSDLRRTGENVQPRPQNPLDQLHPGRKLLLHQLFGGDGGQEGNGDPQLPADIQKGLVLAGGTQMVHGILNSIPLRTAGIAFPELKMLLQRDLLHSGGLPTVGTDRLRLAGAGTVQRQPRLLDVLGNPPSDLHPQICFGLSVHSVRTPCSSPPIPGTYPGAPPCACR